MYFVAFSNATDDGVSGYPKVLNFELKLLQVIYIYESGMICMY